MKSSHTLYKSNGIEELNTLLSDNHNVNLSELIHKYFDFEGEYAAYVGGSIVEGMANGESDLDVYILVDGSYKIKPEFSKHEDFFPIKVGLLWEEYEKDIDGVLFSLIFIEAELIDRISSVLVDMAPGLTDPNNLNSYNMLSDLELQVMHQLRVGWPLFGQELIDNWKLRCLTDFLPIYTSLRAYMLSQGYLEDAFSNMNTHGKTAIHVASISIGYLIRSLIGSFGFTNQHEKWVFKLTERIEDAEAKAVVDRAFHLLHPNLDYALGSTHDYLLEVKQLAEDVKSVLEKNDFVKNIIVKLNDTMHFIDSEEKA